MLSTIVQLLNVQIKACLYNLLIGMIIIDTPILKYFHLIQVLTKLTCLVQHAVDIANYSVAQSVLFSSDKLPM